ncbi:hypothetical protein [Streptomyces sp. NPDC087300]|uniref:hypothetical protein n=1 Tax=Streptomyces sp. NPDC087300 TaxID=3365780 RepID=UPI00380832A4
MVTPQHHIPAPPGKPWPRGLFSAAALLDDLREGADGTWVTDACATGAVLPYCGAGRPAPGPKSFDMSNWLTATPFVVQAGFNCNAVGVYDAREHAERALAAIEQRLVEQTIWRGLGGAASLAEGADDVSGEVPVALVDAIAALEGELAARTGHVGVIHAPAKLGAMLTSQQIAAVGADGVLRTALGTAVVLGAGYDGFAPDGSAPVDGDGNTGVVLYATGPVAVHRQAAPIVNGGDPDGFHTRLNTIQGLAERGYMVAADCPRLKAAAYWPSTSGTPGHTPLKAPANLTLTPDTTSVHAKWDVVEGASDYVLTITKDS